MSFQELRAQYDQGKTEEVLTAIAGMNLAKDHPEYANLKTLEGWCYYRRKEYKKAHDASLAAGNELWARELMAYLYAYAPGYANDEALLQLARELGAGNINIANAMVIRARAATCNLLGHDDVLKTVSEHEKSTGVHAANLHHNAGRFFLDRGRNKDDFAQALALLNQALTLYGLDAHWHHRAAALFWTAKTFEKVGETAHAREAMVASVEHWKFQVKLDPTNQPFQTNLANAEKELARLQAV